MAQKDPKDLVRENRQTRIEQLKQKAKELTGGQMASFASDDCPSAIKENWFSAI